MKHLIGKVVSDKMQKSIMVAVERWMVLPKYNFRMKRHSKIMAHDEHDDCRVGDLVRIEMSRPLSKRKAWKMTDILVKEHVYDPAAAVAESAERLRARHEAARAAWAAAQARLPRSGGRRRAKRFAAQGFAAGGVPPAAGGPAGAGEQPP